MFYIFGLIIFVSVWFGIENAIGQLQRDYYYVKIYEIQQEIEDLIRELSRRS